MGIEEKRSALRENTAFVLLFLGYELNVEREKSWIESSFEIGSEAQMQELLTVAHFFVLHNHCNRCRTQTKNDKKTKGSRRAKNIYKTMDIGRKSSVEEKKCRLNGCYSVG